MSFWKNFALLHMLNAEDSEDLNEAVFLYSLEEEKEERFEDDLRKMEDDEELEDDEFDEFYDE